jgi:hypothetical protein
VDDPERGVLAGAFQLRGEELERGERPFAPRKLSGEAGGLVDHRALARELEEGEIGLVTLNRDPIAGAISRDATRGAPLTSRAHRR